MAKIIIPELVLEAIELARPTAIAILRFEGATWGPKMIVGFVNILGMEMQIPYSFNAEGENAEWNPEWKSPDAYVRIASKKLGLVMKHELNTSVIVALFPGLLDEGEFLYAGGAYRTGIGGASASGAKGWADEAISEHVLININMLTQLEKDRRILAGHMEI
jgi:hypothetical protein